MREELLDSPTACKILFAQPQKSGWLRVYETHPFGQFPKR